jgi:hypothetical protein
MTAPTISATPKKALDQRATSRHDNADAGDVSSLAVAKVRPMRTLFETVGCARG